MKPQGKVAAPEEIRTHLVIVAARSQHSLVVRRPLEAAHLLLVGEELGVHAGRLTCVVHENVTVSKEREKIQTTPSLPLSTYQC